MTRVSLPLIGLLSEIDVPLIAVDRHSCIRWLNQAFEATFGFAREQIVGRRPPLPFWPDDEVDAKLAFWNEVILAVSEGERCRLPYSARTAAGELYPCEVIAEPVESSDEADAGVLCALSPLAADHTVAVRFRLHQRRRQIQSLLSRREAEVVSLLLDGLRVPEIARRLYVSPHISAASHSAAAARSQRRGSMPNATTD